MGRVHPFDKGLCHSEGGALSRTVPRQAVLGNQKRWYLSPGSQSKALQDGGDQHVEGPAIEERLDGLHRFERCLPFGGSNSRTQEIPPFCLGRADI